MRSDLVKYNEAARWWNTERPLTHPSGSSREGLAVNATQNAETWLPVLSKAGQYEVSNLGNVRSLRGPKPRLLKPQPNGKYGYLSLSLGRGVRRYVHRLVMEAFVGLQPDAEVDHIDGDVTNNCRENLRYMTHAENMIARRERTSECKRGHKFAGNEIWYAGRRTCRTCAEIREAKRVRP